MKKLGKTVLFLLAFLTASLALGNEGKFRDRLTLFSLDLPRFTSISQLRIDCDKRAMELRNALNKIAGNLKVPQQKLGMYTDLYLYDPFGNGIDSSYVCSLFLRSDDLHYGFRLTQFPAHKGKDYLAQCKADSDALATNQNMLLIQTDAGWALIGGNRCQTYGVEVGQK